MQCAAVITHLLFTIVPPQKCPPLLVIDTSHGNSPGFAGSPPTIRPSRRHCRPHGTSATEVILVVHIVIVRCPHCRCSNMFCLNVHLNIGLLNLTFFSISIFLISFHVRPWRVSVTGRGRTACCKGRFSLSNIIHSGLVTVYISERRVRYSLNSVMMKARNTSETSVNLCQIIWRNVPEVNFVAMNVRVP